MIRLAYIFSFYILLLTAIPCIDAHLDTSFTDVEQSQSDNSSHQNTTDHCSPFCTCDCCVSPVIYQDFTIQLESFTISNKYYFEYTTTDVISIPATIWQPPKI